MNSNNSNINYFINGSKWIKLGLLDKGLVIISEISYRRKNIIHFIFYTTIEHLMTVTGSSSSTCSFVYVNSQLYHITILLTELDDAMLNIWHT